MYCQVTQPILGMFHFAGEATGVHHVWVVGSLNCAYRSVLEIVSHYHCRHSSSSLTFVMQLIHEGNLAMIEKLNGPLSSSEKS
jgi:hypothetical protein